MRLLQGSRLGLLALLLLTTIPAWAQEEPGPVDSTIGWVFRWLNIALVLGLIGYALAKKGAPFFASQAKSIETSIREAATALERAQGRRRDAQAKLANVHAEVAALRAAAQRDAAAEAERIRAQAREDAAKIAHIAQSEIQAAERAARLELKAAGARLTVARAEVMLRKELTAPAQAALVRSFIEDLSRGIN